MIKAIFFDFDGTIADTAPGIVKTMEQTFLRMGTPIPSEAEMRSTIGLPLKQALQQLGQYSDADAEKATLTYRQLFSTYEVGYVRIFPGVKETLEELARQGLRLAIVTSRESFSLDSICQRHGIDSAFETRVTATDNLTPKPAPDMVLTLLQRMGLQKEEVLVVGDTTFDIGMGQSAGCRTVAVSYGNHSRDTLTAVGPTYLVDRFDTLLDILSNLK